VLSPTSTRNGEAPVSPPTRTEVNPSNVEENIHPPAPVERRASVQPEMSVAVSLWLLVVVTVVRTYCDSDAQLLEFPF